ncbi:MAG TPA: hypothetical protein VGF01_05620, partial [Terracidiphilus sp.]
DTCFSIPTFASILGKNSADEVRLACIIHEDAEDEALGGAGLAKMRMVAGFCHAGVRDSSGGHLAP